MKLVKIKVVELTHFRINLSKFTYAEDTVCVRVGLYQLTKEPIVKFSRVGCHTWTLTKIL